MLDSRQLIKELKKGRKQREDENDDAGHAVRYHANDDDGIRRFDEGPRNTHMTMDTAPKMVMIQAHECANTLRMMMKHAHEHG